MKRRKQRELAEQELHSDLSIGVEAEIGFSQRMRRGHLKFSSTAEGYELKEEPRQKINVHDTTNTQPFFALTWHVTLFQGKIHFPATEKQAIPNFYEMMPFDIRTMIFQKPQC